MNGACRSCGLLTADYPRGCCRTRIRELGLLTEWQREQDQMRAEQEQRRIEMLERARLQPLTEAELDDLVAYWGEEDIECCEEDIECLVAEVRMLRAMVKARS